MEHDPIERLYAQLDRMEDTLERVRPELVAIRTDLNYHIHRSNLLEQKMELVDQDVIKLRGFFTITGWLIGITATILTILNSLGLIG